MGCGASKSSRSAVANTPTETQRDTPLASDEYDAMRGDDRGASSTAVTEWGLDVAAWIGSIARGPDRLPTTNEEDEEEDEEERDVASDNESSVKRLGEALATAAAAARRANSTEVQTHLHDVRL